MFFLYNEFSNMRYVSFMQGDALLLYHALLMRKERDDRQIPHLNPSHGRHAIIMRHSRCMKPIQTARDLETRRYRQTLSNNFYTAHFLPARAKRFYSQLRLIKFSLFTRIES